MLCLWTYCHGQVDAQSILDCMGGGNGGVPAVTKAYHEGLVQSVQATFKVMGCRLFGAVTVLLETA